MGHASGSTNYLITQSQQQVTAGSQPGLFIVNLTISPINNALLAAAEFTVEGAVETVAGSGIWDCTTATTSDPLVEKVIFTNNGTPSTTTNTVNAEVFLDTFTMPSSNKTINVDIDLIKEPPAVKQRYLCINDNALVSDSGYVGGQLAGNPLPHTITDTCYSFCDPSPSISGLNNQGGKTWHHYITVPEGTQSKIFERKFTADSGFHYLVPPQLRPASVAAPAGTLQTNFTFQGLDWEPYITIDDDSQDVFDSNGDLIERVISVYYEPPIGVTGMDPDPTASGGVAQTPQQMCELGLQLAWKHELRAKNPTAGNLIHDIVISSNDIDYNGESRLTTIVADPGTAARFYAVRKDSNGNITGEWDWLGVANGSWVSVGTSAGGIVVMDVPPVGPQSSASNTFSVAHGSSDAANCTPPSWVCHNQDTATIRFDAVTETTTYEIYVLIGLSTMPSPGGTDLGPYCPHIGTLNNAGPLILTQPYRSMMTISTESSGGKFDTSPTAVTCTGVKTFNVGENRSTKKDIRWTITQAMIKSGEGAHLSIKENYEFEFSNQDGSSRTIVSGGRKESSSVAVTESTQGLVVGMEVHWETFKSIMQDVDDSKIIIVDNTKNLVVGMTMVGNGVRPRTYISSINGNIITLDKTVTLKKTVPLSEENSTKTFGQNSFYADAHGVMFIQRGNDVTISSLPSGDNKSILLSKSVDFDGGLELEFSNGGTEFNFRDGKAIKVNNDVLITGTMYVSNWGSSDFTTKLDLDSVITLTN